jgi:hypothetical protein
MVGLVSVPEDMEMGGRFGEGSARIDTIYRGLEGRLLRGRGFAPENHVFLRWWILRWPLG